MTTLGAKILDDERFKKAMKKRMYWVGLNDLKKEG